MTFPSTERLTFRRMNDADQDAVFRLFSDPDAMQFWSSPPMASRKEAITYLEEDQQFNDSGEGVQLGLILRETEELVGTCTFHKWSRSNRRAEVGYMLRRDLWGKGLMSEALSAFLAYGFEVMNLHRVEADIDPANLVSAKLLERLGFQREGLLRERWIVNGVVSDTAYYGLLAHERLGRTRAEARDYEA